MPNIQINIKNKVARADRAIIVCDNSDYVAVFDFDDEWSAYETKTARFAYCGKYTDVVFTGNSCPIPKIQDTRSLSVGVYAGDLHTTTPAYISCVPSILFGNGIPADPTPEVYAQIMELLNKESGIWYPAVDDAGNMSWTRSISETEPQPVNIKGPKGDAGANGADGNDGISPAVSVTAITGGNRITITDAEGAKTFDVMDGAQGASGADGKDYVLTDADKQEIAETAAGLVDVPSVQSDWNQNDETAADYVKNRPFYTGTVETVLMEESTVEFVKDHGMYVAEFSSTFVLTVGETYKVYWDGAAYECTCVSFSNIPLIGNLSIMGGGSDTGEPFLIGVKNGVKIQIVAADASASHTFSISRFAQEVVKIDPKYIRDMYYTGNPVETVLVEESTAEFVENNGLYGTRFPSTFEATVGETYKVYWDDAAYECTCVKLNNKPVIGNLSIPGAGSDTGEPFVMQVKNGDSITIVAADTAASHTFSISGLAAEVVKIDPKYLPDTIATKSEVEAAQTAADDAWNKANNAQTTANASATKKDPVFSGSFSQNRKTGTEIGSNSHAEGQSCTASGARSHAEGFLCIASGSDSHAEGFECIASGSGSHAEGQECTAEGYSSHAEGIQCTASGSHSHAEGFGCTAQGKFQHVQGKYNIASGTLDSIVDSDYAHIVGNGTDVRERSNAHTLTWSGVPWYQGRPQFGGTAMDNGAQAVMANGDKEIILTSSTVDSTKQFKITVGDDYNVSATNTSDSVSKTLATTEYVDNSVSNPLNIASAIIGQIAKITAVDNTGKPTAWEAVDMPSGSGVQPDWNQNDSTQPDYVKNRPFYTGTVETVLVEESTVSFADYHGLYVAQVQSTFSATVGETYKVYWDGAVYECTCVKFQNNPTIGNLSIAGTGSDTGEPFVMQVANGAIIAIATADTAASHTFSISGFVPEVVKIDKKYLPEPETDPYILITQSSNGTYSCNMTYDEIAELYAKYSDAIGLFDMRYNVFYLTGNGNKGTQYRCISVRHSDNLYFAFGFTNDHYYIEILIKKYGTIEPNDNATVMYMDQHSFTDGYYPLIVKSSTANSTKKFKITVDDSGAPTITNESDSTNTWKPTNLPTVAESDAGKFLRVSDTGEWVAETILSASGVSF